MKDYENIYLSLTRTLSNYSELICRVRLIVVTSGLVVFGVSSGYLLSIPNIPKGENQIYYFIPILISIFLILLTVSFYVLVKNYYHHFDIFVDHISIIENKFKFKNPNNKLSKEEVKLCNKRGFYPCTKEKFGAWQDYRDKREKNKEKHKYMTGFRHFGTFYIMIIGSIFIIIANILIFL